MHSGHTLSLALQEDLPITVLFLDSRCGRRKLSKEALGITKRMSHMASEIVLSGSFLEFGQIYQEGIAVAFAYRRHRCDALHSNYLQGEILQRNSREKGGKAEVTRGAA